MSEEIKIEKNVPVQKRWNDTGTTDALKKMKVGDSFVAKSYRNVHSIARQCGVSVTTRRQPDGAYRIWRKA